MTLIVAKSLDNTSLGIDNTLSSSGNTLGNTVWAKSRHDQFIVAADHLEPIPGFPG